VNAFTCTVCGYSISRQGTSSIRWHWDLGKESGWCPDHDLGALDRLEAIQTAAQFSTCGQLGR
jgi:hypothetical protein